MGVTYQTRDFADDELLPILTPLVRQWFSTSFTSFAPPQRRALMPIHSRLNTLVSAPTGSGKTLTAFLSILNELVDSAQKGILRDQVYCVYVSPLKALNNDIQRNLLKPLKELCELEGADLGIRVAVRTGDTTPYERQKMLHNPPHILITTPESLAILLSTKRFSQLLCNVQWTIIDEIHSLAENKRGAHMSLSMERLQRLSPGMCRVGLSATVAPIEEIGRYLVGQNRDVQIVDAQFVKNYDLQVMSPVNNLIDTPHFVMHKAMYSLLHKLIQEHKTTLIFTNTRAGTERVVDTLKEKYPKFYDKNIGAHHGSMGKEMRHQVEQELKEGKLKACVSSTSLELGIDIGSIDLVICLGSPKSVARFLQRVGRAGHGLGETVKGRLIVMNRDDLVECSVLLKYAVEKNIDRIHIPRLCLDVLAQQIAGMALETIWDEQELYTLIRQSYCYKDLTWKSFNEILNYLSGEFVSLEERYIFAKIWRNEGKIGKKGRMARVIYMMNVGTIPDQTFITVKIGEQIVGRLDEAFQEKLNPGDVFVLGGSMYMFKYSRGMTAQVVPTPNRPPTVPSWVSESLPLSFDLASGIGKFRRLVSEQLRLGKQKKDIIAFIHHYLYVDDMAAEAIYHYFKEQHSYCQLIGHDKQLVVEEISDEMGTRYVFHTMFGRRVNDCLSRAIAFIASRRTQRDVQVAITDNGFTIAGAKNLSIRHVMGLLRSDKIDMVMSRAIEKSEVYKRRFRHCAERALMILKKYAGRKKSVGRSQVSSTILLNALKRISTEFSIIEEAKREVLEDLMDITQTKKIVKRIEDGTIRVDYRKSDLPSPFGFSIALQGRMDVMKIEDRHEFLRRMHGYVLAKIAVSGQDVEVPQELLQPSYEELWDKQEKEQEEKLLDKKTLLIQDAQQAIQRLKLPQDYVENFIRLIEGETTGYREDFVQWLQSTFSGPVPKVISDDLAKFVLEKKQQII
ncbi:ATP-dependent helicase [Candidatus Woesearchaeota archaeon]|nr:ATP-dependent helicase [Candidatus Woesearchaeota archaeon]